MSASALSLASHFKILPQSFFVVGKALSGELSCMGTGLITVKTLNIGTPRPATVVVLYIKQFNFTMK